MIRIYFKGQTVPQWIFKRDGEMYFGCPVTVVVKTRGRVKLWPILGTPGIFYKPVTENEKVTGAPTFLYGRFIQNPKIGIRWFFL